jgi:acyl-CoA oxidase
MLGSSEFIPRPAFMASIWRVAVGSISLSTSAVSAMLLSVTIGAHYSLRRTVLGSSETPFPIINFRTQQIPIFTALAQGHVLRAFDTWAVRAFMESEADLRVRHGIAACFKVAVVQLCQAANLSVSDRCGVQGLFEHNQMSVLHVRARLSEHRHFAYDHIGRFTWRSYCRRRYPSVINSYVFVQTL